MKVGKFPFSANARALAAGAPDGMVKIVAEAKYGEVLGVHMVGHNVTELIAEIGLGRALEDRRHRTCAPNAVRDDHGSSARDAWAAYSHLVARIGYARTASTGDDTRAF